MQIVFEKAIESASASSRSITRSVANLVKLPSRSEALFALFFGESIFHQRRLVTAVSAAIKAFPPSKRNLDAFLEFYNLILGQRRQRLVRAKLGDTNKTSVFCHPRVSARQGERKATNDRFEIKSTDVIAARVECKSPVLARIWHLGIRSSNYID